MERDVDAMLDKLRTRYRNGSFTYADPSRSWKEAVSAEFEKYTTKTWGVYVLRRRDSREIIRIGKSGTLDETGQFTGGQDLPGRLRNKQTGDTPADHFFKRLVEEGGAISVEYIVLHPLPEGSNSLTAALQVHAALVKAGVEPLETPDSVKAALSAAFDRT
jgi:hypothetical protein